MPYFPPADLPPPPIVQTVPTPGDAARAHNQAFDKAANQGARSLRPTTPPAAARTAELSAPSPEALVSQARLSSGAVLVPTDQISSELAEHLRTGTLQQSPATAAPVPATGRSPAFSPSAGEATTRRLPQLSAPWLSQSGSDSSAENATTESEDAEGLDRSDPDSDPPARPRDPDAESSPETPDAEPAPTFPRAASPEPFWSNGAVENGVLLTPSQPTNRPPSPLDLTADYQEFEPGTQVLEARGNVVLRLSNGVLSADQLWANLANRFVLAEGNVIFTRGEQTIEADRGEYNLIQGQGSLFDARGTLFLPDTDTDFADLTQRQESNSPGILETDPITNVRGTNNITFGTGVTAPTAAGGIPQPTLGGAVRRFRFEAAQLDFDSEGWYAQDISLTNDPFSPPELEFRGNRATLTRLDEFQDELYVENARLVFDQGFTVPLLRDRVLISRGGPESANPFFVNIGFDGDDRDGLFVERSFRVFGTRRWEFLVTPQFLAQRFVGGEDDPPEEETSFLSNFGLEADVNGVLGPRTFVAMNASFSGLDIDNLDDRLRASVRLEQLVGTHSLNVEYIYRDRLFNGSLGFQDVQSSLGVVLVSPSIPLGDTGIFLDYQASAQYINANTDQRDLADSPPFRATLGRFQGSFGLSRGFTLWQGERLPATPNEGLRFTPIPRRPNLQLILAGRGTYTYYTSDDTQQNLSGIVGIRGELGQFSDDFFDSTVFNLTYRRSFVGEDSRSPFLFDRDVDTNRLTGGIIQQIYGPFRLGFQTSVNLDTGEVINTDYVLQYNRRTYSLILRYNPTRQSGFVGFRLNEFDWAGRAARFGGADIREVEGGVVQ